MIQTIKVINIYSELNPFIDFIVNPVDVDDTELIKEILEEALDRWLDIDNYPDLQSIPIGDYLKECLDERHLNYEMYCRLEDEEDIWTE